MPDDMPVIVYMGPPIIRSVIRKLGCAHSVVKEDLKARGVPSIPDDMPVIVYMGGLVIAGVIRKLGCARTVVKEDLKV